MGACCGGMKTGHKSLPEKKQPKHETSAEKHQNLISANNGSQNKESPRTDNNLDTIKHDEVVPTAVENGSLTANLQGGGKNENNHAVTANETPCIEIVAQKNESVSPENQQPAQSGDQAAIEEMIAAKLVTEAMEAAIALSTEKKCSSDEITAEGTQANEPTAADEEEALTEWMKVDTRNALVIEETIQDNQVKLVAEPPFEGHQHSVADSSNSISNEPLLYEEKESHIKPEYYERNQEISYHEVTEKPVDNQNEIAVNTSSNLFSPSLDIESEAITAPEYVENSDQTFAAAAQASSVNADLQNESISGQPDEIKMELPLETCAEKSLSCSPPLVQSENDFSDPSFFPPPPPLSVDDIEIQETVTGTMNSNEMLQNLNEAESTITPDEADLSVSTKEVPMPFITKSDHLPADYEHHEAVNQSEMVPLVTGSTEHEEINETTNLTNNISVQNESVVIGTSSEYGNIDDNVISSENATSDSLIDPANFPEPSHDHDIVVQKEIISLHENTESEPTTITTENITEESLIEAPVAISVTHAESEPASPTTPSTDDHVSNFQKTPIKKAENQSNDAVVESMGPEDEGEVKNEFLLHHDVSLEASHQRQQWWLTGAEPENDTADSIPPSCQDEASISPEGTQLEISLQNHNSKLVHDDNENSSLRLDQMSLDENSKPVIIHEHIKNSDALFETSEVTSEPVASTGVPVETQHDQETSPHSPSDEDKADEVEKKPLIDVAVTAHA